ncbi:MAG: Ig-like domain-containing protein [Firmicutes bacterium]|nr:Ig-like domain-containing protein [Bacillota bacterium]
MKKTGRKVIAYLMIVSMIVTYIPTIAFAAEEEVNNSVNNAPASSATVTPEKAPEKTTETTAPEAAAPKETAPAASAGTSTQEDASASPSSPAGSGTSETGTQTVTETPEGKTDADKPNNETKVNKEEQNTAAETSQEDPKEKEQEEEAAKPASDAASMKVTGTFTVYLENPVQTVQLTATNYQSDGKTKASDQAITWTSSDPSTATVSSTGLVTVTAADIPAGKTATVKITAKAANNSSISVTKSITIRHLAVTNVTISVSGQQKAYLGTNEQYTTTTSPAYAMSALGIESYSVKWSVDNPSVATISEDGVLTPVSAGKVSVTAQATIDGSTKTAKKTITVAEPVRVTGIKLNATTASLNKGQDGSDSKKLTASITPTTATNKAVSWTSSDEDVATVDANGNVKAAGAGTATITAASQDGSEKTASCQVTVLDLENMELTLSAGKLDLRRGETASLTASLGDTAPQQLTWTVTGDACVVPGAYNRANPQTFYGCASGSAVITATAVLGGKTFTATCPITVSEEGDVIELVQLGALSDIHIPYGTAKDLIPFVVNGTAVDANGYSVEVYYDHWNCEDYDPKTPGTYIFTSDVKCTAPYFKTNNDTETVSVKVIVESQEACTFPVTINVEYHEGYLGDSQGNMISIYDYEKAVETKTITAYGMAGQVFGYELDLPASYRIKSVTAAGGVRNLNTNQEAGYISCKLPASGNPVITVVAARSWDFVGRLGYVSDDLTKWKQGWNDGSVAVEKDTNLVYNPEEGEEGRTFRISESVEAAIHEGYTLYTQRMAFVSNAGWVYATPEEYGFTINEDGSVSISQTFDASRQWYMLNFYKKNYTVTYTDGVENTTVFADKSVTALQGDSVPAFGEAPVRSGYTFAGWDVDPASIDAVNGDLVFTAQWTAKPSRKPEPAPTPEEPEVIAPEEPAPDPTAEEIVPDEPASAEEPEVNVPEEQAPAEAPEEIIPEEPAPAAPAAIRTILPAAVTTAAQTVTSASDAEESYTINISDEEAPLALPEVIEDEAVPQAFAEGFWALINLLSAAGTCLIALGMIITFLRNRKEDEEEAADQSENKRRKIKFFGLIPAAAAVIAFLLTEDMSLTMQMTDKWTLLMVVILIASMAAAFLTRNKKNNEEEENAAA